MEEGEDGGEDDDEENEVERGGGGEEHPGEKGRRLDVHRKTEGGGASLLSTKYYPGTDY